MTAPVPPDLEETNVLGGGPGAPPPDPEPDPSRRLGWGMLLGLLVLIAVAGAAAAAWFAAGGGDDREAAPATTAQTTQPATTALLPAGQVFVPDVTGLKEREAAQRLGAAGLEPQVRRKATAKPTGTVVSQSPKAAAHAKKGSQVAIVVDAGAATKAVPDVTGLDVAAAGARLKKAGFAAKTTKVTSDEEPGTVVAQAPEADEKAEQGAVVTLSVAKQADGATTAEAQTTTAQQPSPPPPPQPSTASVPDLRGQVLADAAEALGQAGIYPDVAYIPSDEPLGTVVEQAKQPGTEVPRGSFVRVNVSQGPDPGPATAVPDVRGRARADAMHTLSGAGFEVKVLERPVSSSRPADTVIDEQPTSAARIPRGALVILVVGTHRTG